MTRVFRSGASLMAVAAATLCVLALGTRTLGSVDLGYHLAYGEHALETGRLVDHNPYLYTLPPEDLSGSQRPALGPGNWYDERGRYRFPTLDCCFAVWPIDSRRRSAPG